MSLSLPEVLGIVNLIVVIVGVGLLWKQISENQKWNKSKQTFDYMMVWDSPDFRDKTVKLFEYGNPFDSKQSFSDIEKKIKKKDKESYLHILRMELNYFDSIGTGIKAGLLDEAVCKETMHVNMRIIHKWAKPYIKKIRKDIEPQAWIEIDQLLEKWGKEKNPTPKAVD